MTDSHPQRWRILGLLALAELLGMSLWFTASAVSPDFAQRWALGPGQVAWLTTAVQLGFVAGTALAALLNLADLWPARRYFAGAAVLAAGANALLVLAPGYGAVLTLRFLTGLFLAGVYPPAMKMIATWFRTARGLAIGTVVGALTLGKAMPFLVDSLRSAGLALADVILLPSAGALAAAGLVWLLYRDGPYAFARRPFSWRLVGAVLRDRPTRLAIGGYLGHMWELYAMWALVTLFYADYFLAHGARELVATTLASATGFMVIGAGAIGAIVAGVAADRWGRERVAAGAMLISGTCALTIGWLAGAAVWLVVGLGVLWGVTIVADSAQFSALVTEVAPGHAVGTALTLQTSLGFALTAFSIWLAAWLADAAGWGVAFGMLAVGPALGIAAMVRLERLRRNGRGSGGVRGAVAADGSTLDPVET